MTANSVLCFCFHAGSSVSAMPSILCFTEGSWASYYYCNLRLGTCKARIICFCHSQGEHPLLMLVGLVSFLAMPFPFLAVSIWATWVLGRKIADKHGCAMGVSGFPEVVVLGQVFFLCCLLPAALLGALELLAQSASSLQCIYPRIDPRM